jgi:hypothetical protein
MTRSSTFLLALAVAGTAAAAAPALKDFARGFEIYGPEGYPAYAFTLPEDVYLGVQRPDLGDLRVFNDGGIVVPHALCTGPVAAATPVREEPLQVFPLAAARAPGPGDTRVNVTTPQGTSVQVVEPQAPAPGTPDAAGADAPAAYVADASRLRDPIRALRFGWSTTDGAAEVTVRVEASEDLDSWRVLVPRTTLLRTTADGRLLERARVELPEGRYRYLRIEREGGAPPQVTSVDAEVAVAAPIAALAEFWAVPAPRPEGEAGFLYDTQRLAPVEEATVHLPMPNMRIDAALDSRAADTMPWQQRWTGSASSVRAGDGASGRFGAVTDRHWRLRVLRGGETLGTARPTLQLGYRAARLQFLAQGPGPWVLAFGSARVPPADAAPCDSLLGALPAEVRTAQTGAVQLQPAAAARLGGNGAYAVPPEPTPLRLIVLCSILGLGAVLLVAMALSLLKKLGTDS